MQNAVKALTLLQDRGLADFATGVGWQVDDQWLQVIKPMLLWGGGDYWG